VPHLLFLAQDTDTDSIDRYLVGWTTFGDDDIAGVTADSDTIRINQSSIMLTNAADTKQEISLPIKHLQAT